MRGRRSLGAWVLGLVLGARGSMAGYLDVVMSPARQCEQSTVQWSGDDGPYHLLLTPTAHVQHGYNVWLPSIPNGTNSYNLTIRQPAGLQYIVTVWGASGISYAGTTDVLTVGAPVSANASCYLSDDGILGLYSFSFNISDTSNDLPPQCSNLTMSWPTSLESNVSGTITKRDEDLLDAVEDVVDASLPESIFDEKRDTSSSEHTGNTSYPPSMFGVIPLGNSFSIPITYNRSSRYAKYLPDSARSDNPTTWTSKGVTSLNWTVNLAKGTRFILVAGIGSDQQWASGGSSALLTVGQGTTDCANSGDSGSTPVPSVTATNDDSAPTGGSSGSTGSSGPSNLVRTILACVLSILGTLLIVGLLAFCWRARRRRRQITREGLQHSSGSLRKFNRASGTDTQDTPLDLVGSRDGPRVAPILTNNGHVDSPGELSPTGSDPFINAPQRPYGTDTLPSSGTYSSSASPIDRVLRGGYPRTSSTDPLLANNSPSRMSSSLNETYNTLSTHRPLTLHDRGMGLPFEADEEDIEGETPDLKRETLAYLGDAPPSGSGLRIRPMARGQRRRRGDEEQEMEYVVHRDAGRIGGPRQAPATRVELPPRYDELNWEGEDPGPQAGVGGGGGVRDQTTGQDATGSMTVVC